MSMYRYDYYYGYWESDSDSDGGDTRYRPNIGEGGRDTGYVPGGNPVDPPPPPPPPPPVQASLVSTTPAIMTLDDTSEYNVNTTYKPAGQFTETHAWPLAFVKSTGVGPDAMVTVNNGRAEYSYTAMNAQVFKFPYYVPADANLATLPYPKITWQISMNVNTGYVPNGTTVYLAAADKPLGNNLTVTATVANTPTPSAVQTFTLVTDQMLNFEKGKFNDFLFRINVQSPQLLLADTNRRLNWMVSDIQTSLPNGYQFEFKLQKNWETYFNINVVKGTDRTIKGTSTGLTSVAVTPRQMGNGRTLSANWQWNEYDIANQFRHWEIPVSTWPHNKTFDWPIIAFPENDDYCSMEPTVKTPGPQAPWNLFSRHETYWYAQFHMRKTDYAQQISNTAVFYCPRNWRAVVWLKQGIAQNDVI